MSYEDLTGVAWTEVDPNNDITRAGAGGVQCAFDTMRRDVDAYVYGDYGVDHFDDYTHQFEVSITATSGGNIIPAVWGVTGTPGSGIDNNTGLTILASAAELYFYLKDEGNANQAYDGNFTLVEPYYITVVQNGTTAIASVYTDAIRTTKLFNDLTITSVTTARRYLLALAAEENTTSGPDRTISGWSQNFDIGEGTPPAEGEVSPAARWMLAQRRRK